MRPARFRIAAWLSGLLGCLMSACPAGAVETFTLAGIGDQQVPVRNTNYYTSFTAQTDWLAANAQANNIRFVTQLGDIVEHGNDLAQWGRAEAAMATLDTGVDADGGIGIPWNVVYGNHETDTTQPGSDPAGARADRYREYFGSSGGTTTHRYQGQVGFGGVSSNDLNTYHIVKSSAAPDAREYLMLSMEYDIPGHAPGSTPAPGDSPAFDAIAWAQGVIDAHPGKPTIISTHVFAGTQFGPPNDPYTAGPGRNSQLQIFDKLVKDNSQVFMVLSGHTSQDTHHVKNNAVGLPVLQMVTDYNKVVPNGGDGFMRLIELDEGAGEIRVNTFTPGVPQDPTPRYRTDANSQFVLGMDWKYRFDSGPPPPPGINVVVDLETGEVFLDANQIASNGIQLYSEGNSLLVSDFSADVLQFVIQTTTSTYAEGAFVDVPLQGLTSLGLIYDLTVDARDLTLEYTQLNMPTVRGRAIYIPESASLVLMGMGGLLLCRRRAA